MIAVKKTIFIKNAMILTVSGLILRLIGIVFKVWLAKLIGSEGIGLYGLVFSVFVLASTFATSGISTAVTRLCADALANNNQKGIKNILKKSIFVTLIIAFISMAILIFGADFIARRLLFEERCKIAIQILSLSLPFMGICSCLRGYFIARRKATAPALSQIFEQIIRIAVVFFGVKLTLNKGLAVSCGAVLLGDVIAEIFSCLYLYSVYKHDIKRVKNTKSGDLITGKIYEKIKEIAFPITLGRYLNSFLRTTENILVPKQLKLYKLSGINPLSQFGMIKGMALPLVFFPSTMLNSVSTLLIPELSEALSKNYKSVVKKITEKILFLTSLGSVYFASVFFVCGRQIGLLLYGDQGVGVLIKMLAPIVPLMYLDSICDGMLKGLNQQKFTFKVSISDSSIRIILVILVLPYLGIKGFVYIMYFSNCFSAFLNVLRVVSIGGTDFKWLRTSLFSAVFALFSLTFFDNIITHFLDFSILGYILTVIPLSFALFMILEVVILKINIKELL